MKTSQIKKGGLYTAKVSGKLVTVRVDVIRESQRYRGDPCIVYDVTNLSTGRKITFRSAQKFRSSVVDKKGRVGKTVLNLPDDTSVEENLAEEATEQPLTLSDQLRSLKVKTDDAPHVIVEARAGTGKTTTLIAGLYRVKGLDRCPRCKGEGIVQAGIPVTCPDCRGDGRFHLIPSPQQAVVWEAMEQSRDKAQSVCFVAFNKSIATELQLRVPQGCDAMTTHSMGFRAVQQALGRYEPNSFVVQDIIADLLGMDIYDLRRKKPVVLKAAEQLVSLCKMNLTDPNFRRGEEVTTIGVNWPAALSDLAAYYDIDLNGESREVFDLVPRVLERCKDPQKQGNRINFDDMIWLPIVLDLPVQKYDLLLVDEAQDLNRCQQALAKKAGKRLILCGDPKQAIYGFAGADSESMARMERELKATDRGCVHLPLTVTRRCGKAIVREAQRYVPDFSAFETNAEGKISSSPIEGEQSYRSSVSDGDMVLSRVNAPLVSECFKFLRAGKKANIQGRDVGAGLISTTKKCLKVKEESELLAKSVEELIGAVSGWLYAEEIRENAKRNPSETRLVALRDRHDCLVCFTEGAMSAAEVVRKINSIFTDDKNGTGIRLSSIHKAKGLEANRVFFIRTKDAPCPHPMAKTAWEQEQEANLCYVAITRAREELIYVTD